MRLLTLKISLLTLLGINHIKELFLLSAKNHDESCHYSVVSESSII